MTAVVAKFPYQGALGVRQIERLGLSYTSLGVRKIEMSENQRIIAVEYDATRMDRAGVAAMLRRLGIPIVDAAAAQTAGFIGR